MLLEGPPGVGKTLTVESGTLDPLTIRMRQVLTEVMLQ